MRALAVWLSQAFQLSLKCLRFSWILELLEHCLNGTKSTYDKSQGYICMSLAFTTGVLKFYSDKNLLPFICSGLFSKWSCELEEFGLCILPPMPSSLLASISKPHVGNWNFLAPGDHQLRHPTKAAQPSFPCSVFLSVYSMKMHFIHFPSGQDPS